MSKMTQKQLTKWLNSLPETTNVWEINEDAAYTVQQVNAVLGKHDYDRQACGKFHEELLAIDSLLTANAESDAAENMPSELNDMAMIGYWNKFHNHLVSAAQCHWEGAGRDLNAELGRIVC